MADVVPGGHMEGNHTGIARQAFLIPFSGASQEFCRIHRASHWIALFTIFVYNSLKHRQMLFCLSSIKSCLRLCQTKPSCSYNHVCRHYGTNPFKVGSKSVRDDLGVDIVGNLLDDSNGYALDQIGVELGKRSEDLVRTLHLLSITLLSESRLWGRTYLGDCRICERMIVNCATMQTIFKCGPYANKKSHNFSTSGNGGVQAQSVSTEGNA